MEEKKRKRRSTSNSHSSSPGNSSRKKHRRKRVPKHAIKESTKRLVLLKRVGNIVFYLLFAAFLLLMGMFGLAQSEDKGVNGYRYFGVLSNSMVSPGDKLKEGGFRAGDIIIIKELPEDSVKVGDIITFHPSLKADNEKNNYLTHRVVQIDNELGGEKGTFFTTRGDANESNDMPFSSTQLVGKVVYRIPIMGSVLMSIKKIGEFMIGNPVISLVFVFSVFGFIFALRMYIFSDGTRSRALSH